MPPVDIMMDTPVGIMPSLKDVSREWEREEALRAHVRQCNTLLQWDRMDDKKISIRNADINFLVLRPLAKRLRDSNGEVGMLHLPQIQTQKLGSISCAKFMVPFFSICETQPFLPVITDWGIQIR